MDETSRPEGDAADTTPTIEITSPELLRAYAHPTRIRLLDVLRVDGPASVSMLSDRIDEAVGSISHHLKILSRAGLIDEAPEKARDRRESWWKIRPLRTTWDRTRMAGAAAQAALQAEELNLARQTELFGAAMHAPLDDPFTGAGFASTSWLHLTAEELSTLGQQIQAVVDPWVERSRRNQADPDVDSAGILFVARGVKVVP